MVGSGMGSCVLRDPAIAKIAADALHHFDNQQYVLTAFVIMPNHVHVLLRLLPNHKLESVIKGQKGFAAREINLVLSKSGPLWQEDYWDRLVRNESHFFKSASYIRDNPTKAHLTKEEFIFYEAFPNAPTTEGGHSCPP
jgi:REP element-mobilizing transposase RayT